MRQAAREIALIVVSILIAFALNAWWDDRSDRVEEQALLRSLQKDFEATRTELYRTRTIHAKRINSGLTMLDLTPSKAAALPADSFAAALWGTLQGTTFDPPQGALQSMLGAGKLSLIDDETLRIQLGGWLSKVEDHSGTEATLREFLHTTAIPLIHTKSPLPARDGLRSTGEIDFPGLLSDYAVANTIQWLVLITRVIHAENEVLEGEIDSIMIHIERQLD